MAQGKAQRNATKPVYKRKNNLGYDNVAEF